MKNNILEAIGNTPLVKINRLNPNPAVSVYAKLEGFNPTGSIKDRIAIAMIEQAEQSGALTHGKIIIEPTSGNTGIALAMIGTIKGYRVQIVMSEAVSIERQKMIRAFGGEIILTDSALGTDGAIMKCRELVAADPGTYFNPNQFSNEYNKLAHYSTTAQEIWEQTGGRVTHFVSALGTSGTIMGVGTRLKSLNPSIKVIEAHPVKGHYIQGLKNMDEAIVPELYDTALIDESIMIETEEAYETARHIVVEEGIFAGMSSGAAMLAAIRVAEGLRGAGGASGGASDGADGTSGGASDGADGATNGAIDGAFAKSGDLAGNGTAGESVIVTIFPDRGEKYLSTNLFKLE